MTLFVKEFQRRGITLTERSCTLCTASFSIYGQNDHSKAVTGMLWYWCRNAQTLMQNGSVNSCTGTRNIEVGTRNIKLKSLDKG